MRRARLLSPILAILAILALVAGPAVGRAEAPPHEIPLPNGFAPEGISIRNGNNLYVGSIPTGAVYRANAHTGEGDILVEAHEGRSAVGLKVRFRKLFVAGGDTGQAYVYDARSGEDISSYQLTDVLTFINDVVVTRDAAYFTDSFNPVLYKLPLRDNGAPAGQGKIETLPLDGVVYEEGFNVNGIDATLDGETLIIVQSNTGFLFTVDADSGRAERIHLGGGKVLGGDGILLNGRTLYVVRNTVNKLAVIELERDLGSGEVEHLVSDPDFNVPTTVATKDGRLYVVNARFSTPPTPKTRYWVTVIPKP